LFDGEEEGHLVLARHETFHSVARGIRWDLLPSRLYERGKRLGAWNPQDIDFSQDREGFRRLDPAAQESFLRLAAGFAAGEEAVTLDLLPLVMTMAREGRLEEEMYLTNFLFEEAKHTEFFRRLLDAIGVHEDLSVYHSPAYRTIFYEELPQAMNRLLTDPSPEAQAEAAVTYNMVVEGVLAETGYFAWRRLLEPSGAMPGTLTGIAHIATDEARHIAYGVYLLSRLVAADDRIFGVVERRLNALMPPALGTFSTDSPRDPAAQAEVLDFARRRFEARLQVIARARGRAPGEIDRAAGGVFAEALGEEA
jgi:ribonucleoside-diphosphate reductase beta chain